MFGYEAWSVQYEHCTQQVRKSLVLVVAMVRLRTILVYKSMPHTTLGNQMTQSRTF